MRLNNIIRVGDKVRLLPIPNVGDPPDYIAGVIVERIETQRGADWMKAARNAVCVFWGTSRWPIQYCERIQ